MVVATADCLVVRCRACLQVSQVSLILIGSSYCSVHLQSPHPLGVMPWLMAQAPAPLSTVRLVYPIHLAAQC